MSRLAETYNTILVGGGPAGMAVLLSAHRDGTLGHLLQRGLLVVERDAVLGCGQIGRYVINSDSTGNTFLDPLRNATEPALLRILETEVALRCAAAGECSVPLTDVGALLELIGEAMLTIIAEYPQCRVRTLCTAESAHSMPGGTWRLKVRDAYGQYLHFETPHLVLATGAGQPADRLQRESVAGEPVMRRWQHQLMQSGEVLTVEGLRTVAERLRGKLNPKVAILGGSTSAMAVAHALLHRLPEVPFGQGAVTLFHRSPLRVYYKSHIEALADGYNDFGPDDLCPLTNRVYRFAGLRLDSRELLLQLYGLGGRPAEARLTMHQLTDQDAEAMLLIDSADLVIPAFGYRPNVLALIDGSGRRIKMLADSSPTSPLVDRECRVLNAEGTPVARVFGIGLAAGFRPSNALGGEPTFSGQVNGLWLWQNGVGSIIANAILAHTPADPRLFQSEAICSGGDRHYAAHGITS